MDNDFLQERITNIKARIVAYEEAALALASGAIQEYSLDTGQTVTRVTKANIKTLQNLLDQLMNQLAVYQQRLNGGGTIQVIPSW